MHWPRSGWRKPHSPCATSPGHARLARRSAAAGGPPTETCPSGESRSLHVIAFSQKGDERTSEAIEVCTPASPSSFGPDAAGAGNRPLPAMVKRIVVSSGLLNSARGGAGHGPPDLAACHDTPSAPAVLERTALRRDAFFLRIRPPLPPTCPAFQLLAAACANTGRGTTSPTSSQERAGSPGRADSIRRRSIMRGDTAACVQADPLCRVHGHARGREG